MLKKFIQKNKIYSLFKSFLPKDTTVSTDASFYAKKDPVLRTGKPKVLDLGCGAGNSIDLFKSINPGICWFGVDVATSPEGKDRRRSDGKFETFDGMHLPYSDNYFDLIYSQQVFEHVRYPDALFQEVVRVLKPGHYFTGSVSYLEPYHSFSIYNFTPYGLMVSLKDAGFEIKELRPGIDGPTLILRQMLNAPEKLERLYHKLSLFNAVVNVTGFLFRLTPRERNFLKLQFAGKICFLVQKKGRGNFAGNPVPAD